MKIVALRAAALLIGFAGPAAAQEITLSVGSSGSYQQVSAAVAADDDDADRGHRYIIHVAPGIYLNDFPQVTRAMTIRLDPAYPSRPLRD